jgi:hypothetical protein
LGCEWRYFTSRVAIQQSHTCLTRTQAQATDPGAYPERTASTPGRTGNSGGRRPRIYRALHRSDGLARGARADFRWEGTLPRGPKSLPKVLKDVLTNPSPQHVSIVSFGPIKRNKPCASKNSRVLLHRSRKAAGTGPSSSSIRARCTSVCVIPAGESRLKILPHFPVIASSS